MTDFHLINLKIDFIFQSSFKFTAKLSREYRDFPYTPCSPCPQTPFPTISISHQRSAFVTTDEPTPTHPNHPKSAVYIRIHPWWCTLQGFWQMYNDKHPTYIQGGRTSLKILCTLPIQPFLSTNPGKSRTFYCLHSFAFSRMPYDWNHTACSLFRLASPTQ